MYRLVGLAFCYGSIALWAQCPPPSLWGLDTAETNRIRMQYSVSSSAVELRYRPYGNGSWKVDTLQVAGNASGSYWVDSLQPATLYEFGLSALCSTGTSSLLTEYARTSCAPISLPYFFNVETVRLSGDVAQACYASDRVLVFAGQISSYQESWRISGATWDATVEDGSGKYLRGEAIDPAGPRLVSDSAILRSPWLDATSGPLGELRFASLPVGQGLDSLEVGWVGQRSGYHSLGSFPGPSQSSTGKKIWERYTLPLGPIADSLVRVRFTLFFDTGHTSNFGSWGIDDIFLGPSSTCKISGLGLDSINSYQAFLSWNGAPNNSYEVALWPAYQEGPQTRRTVFTPNLQIRRDTIKRLAVAVRPICGVDTGHWSGPMVVQFPCGVRRAPWRQNFNGPEWEAYNVPYVPEKIDSCWQNGSSGSIRMYVGKGPTPTFQTGPQKDPLNTDGNYLFHNAGANPQDTARITTPYIYIPHTLQNPYLKWAFHRKGTGIDHLSIRMRVGKGPFRQIWQKAGPSSSASWEWDSLSMGYHRGDSVQLQMRATAKNRRGDAAFDEFSLAETPQPCITPIAGMSFQRSGFRAYFSALGSRHADRYQWTFPGNNIRYTRNPSFLFPGPGTYPVILKAETHCGTQDTVLQYITICDTLKPRFTYRYAGDTLLLDASASEGATGYRWDLDAGKQDTGAVVRVTYGDLQTKRIVLTAYNACDTLEVTRFLDPCPKPEARALFQAGPPPANGGLRVDFNGQPSRFAEAYWWDFGDGDTARGVSPSHVYATPSLNFTVTLVVRSWCGYRDTLTRPLSEIGQDEPAWRRQIKIFPNPSRGALRVQWPETLEITALKLYNARGQRLRRIFLPVQATEKTLSLHALPAGPYFLRVMGPGGQAHFRVVLAPK